MEKAPAHYLLEIKAPYSKNGPRFPMYATQHLPVETIFCASPGLSPKSTDEATLYHQCYQYFAEKQVVSGAYCAFRESAARPIGARTECRKASFIKQNQILNLSHRDFREVTCAGAVGTTGFEAQIDKCLELAEYLYNKIKNREGYEMVFDGKPQHTNVCFWYIPPSLRSMEDNEERMSRLMKVAPVIKARMMEYGTTMVSYQPLGDKVNFFRMVISNPAATHQDIDFLIDEIERLGQDL